MSSIEINHEEEFKKYSDRGEKIVRAILITISCAACAWAGYEAGVKSERSEWQKEIVSRGYGEWVQSKEDPTRNVFAWKEK